MVAIGPVREGNQKPRVGNAFHGLPNPLREERSLGPRTTPANLRKDWLEERALACSS